jgi:ABC-type lipoprotein release transport system permease subunit
MIATPRHTRIVSITGIDPEAEGRVSILDDAIVDGTYLAAEDANRILLGRRLAERLHIETGKKVVLTGQQLGGEIGSGAFRIAGLFDTGNAAFDEGTVFIVKSAAQAMLNLTNRVSETVFLLNDAQQLEAFADRYRNALAGEPVEVFTWMDRQPLIRESIRMAGTAAYPYYAIFFIAMAIGVINALYMAIGERTRELGVMMAIGMRRSRVMALIMCESLLLALLSGCVGCLVGWGITAWFGQYGLDLSRFAASMDFYGIGRILYPRIILPEVIGALAATVGITLLFALLPAGRAARKRPVDAMRIVR